MRIEVGAAGRIVAVDPGGSADGCERIGGWTVPGVPNVHSHSFQRGLAGLAEGGGPDSFWSWRRVMYAFLERLTPDHVEAITAQLHVEMLKSGFTCVGEFHYLHRAPGGAAYADPAETSRRVIAAARRTGIGLVHMPVVYEAGGFGGDALEGGQERFGMTLGGVARLLDALRGDPVEPGIRLGWGLHSLRAVRPETFARLSDFAPGARGKIGNDDGDIGGRGPIRGGDDDIDDDDGRAPVHIHVSEQMREVRECIARRGTAPVDWLMDRAPVDRRWCLVHATHAGDSELDRVARAGAVVGLCPTTEANLGDGLFPLGQFAGMGGRFGIGTDSHVSRSPVEELRLLDYGQRLKTRRRWVLGGALAAGGRRGADRWSESEPGRAGSAAAGSAATGEGACDGAGGKMLAHAWRDGCRALGWNGGRVEVGARADLVVLDAEHPALVGRGAASVLDSWVFSGTDSPVRDVMVGGRWVVRDGRHEREEEVRRAYARTVKGLADSR